MNLINFEKPGFTGESAYLLLENRDISRIDSGRLRVNEGNLIHLALRAPLECSYLSSYTGLRESVVLRVCVPDHAITTDYKDDFFAKSFYEITFYALPSVEVTARPEITNPNVLSHNLLIMDIALVGQTSEKGEVKPEKRNFQAIVNGLRIVYMHETMNGKLHWLERAPIAAIQEV